jgi:hypothetical protein
MSTDHWEEIFEGFRRASEGLQEVVAGLVQAGEAARIGHAAETDLRETVEELKRMIMDQGAEIRALRDRLNGH